MRDIMPERIRILLCTENADQAGRIEHALHRRCQDCLIRIQPDPELFLLLLAANQFDVAMFDAERPDFDFDSYLPALQAELRAKPLLVLTVPTGESRRLDWRGSGQVEVISKRNGYIDEVVRSIRDRFRVPSRTIVPANRSAAILSERGDFVDEAVSELEDEINNPLMTIFGTIELLLMEQADLSPHVRTKVGQIQRSARRIQKAVEKLSTLARQH